MVVDDLINVCLDILNNNAPLGNINHTHIALIPKSKNPRNLNSFRPTNLCNMSYKVISKVITNRLNTFMDVVIFSTQYAFVHGRLINDNFLVGYECLHAISNNRNKKFGDIALKLDMSKAYHRVE